MEATFTKPKHLRRAMSVLTVVNAGALVAAANLVIWLNPEDKISIKRGSALTALGLVYFMSLFELLNVCALCTGAGARFRRKYRLSAGDVLDITNKLVSAVQAALSVLTGAVVCAWSCTRDFMRASHYMSEAYAWFGAAYFFYDIWSMYMVHVQMITNPDAKKDKTLQTEKPDKPEKVEKKICKNGEGLLSSGDGKLAEGPAARATKPTFAQYCRHEPVILMHHLFIGGFGFLVIVYFRGSFGDCTFGFVYLMELSTPFVSARGILSRLRLKASRAYLLNGLLMLATFFFCRVASLPYVCLMYSRELGLPYFEAIKSLPTGCKISICILLLPQLYWFYLMSAGALKMFLGSSKTVKRVKSVNSTNKSAGDADRAAAPDRMQRVERADRAEEAELADKRS